MSVELCNYEFPSELFEGYELGSNSETVFLKKGEAIDDKILGSHSIIVVKKGLVLLYWENEKKEKTIIDFKSSGGLVYSSTHLKEAEVGKLKTECIKDTELFIIGKQFMCTCSFHEQEVSNLYTSLFADDINSAFRQLKLLKEVNLEKRYLSFLRNYEGIYNHISDRMIASFLGVHHTTLSRIKRKVLLMKD